MANVMKFLAYDGMVKLTCIDTTDVIKKANEIHKLSKTGIAAFGRVLTFSAIMGVDLKQESDNITVQIKGNGPIGTMTCVAKQGGKVKGYVQNRDAEVLPTSDNKLDIKGIVGTQGNIYIIKDLGLKEPYVGIGEIISGDIATDFTNYFATSEQIPTVLSLGVLFDNNEIVSAGGYLLQLMPDATNEVIEKVEQALQDRVDITKMIYEKKSLIDIAKNITKDEDILMMLGEINSEYICDCSKQRFEKGIISLGKKEIDEMIQDNKDIEINCQFCNKEYSFTLDELKNIRNTL